MYNTSIAASFLKVGSLSVFGFLGLGDVLRLRAQSPAATGKRDISIIHLWLTGGMSQLDTFDPKPDTDTQYRSQFKPIETNVFGHSHLRTPAADGAAGRQIRHHPLDDAPAGGARSGAAI